MKAQSGNKFRPRSVLFTRKTAPAFAETASHEGFNQL
jgi:hypothetical protein